MQKKYKWKTEKRKLKQLIPSKYNPRKWSKMQLEKLKESIEKFSLCDPLIINANNVIIGGHFRYKILKEKYGEDYEVDVRIPDQLLSEEEEKELNLRLNKNLGEWDFEMLSKFNEELLRNVGFSNADINKAYTYIDEFYVQNIQMPIYTPHLKRKLNVNELYDDRKVEELLEIIRSANIRDSELKKFLELSAYRFCLLRFDLIAEYYSQLKDEKIKDLFEKLALVIIDYGKAIENGLANCYKDLLEALREEPEDEE